VYLLTAAVIIAASGWYFSTLDDCSEADTGRCDLGTEALVVTVIVLVLVMPAVMFFGEAFARDRRRRTAPDNPA
jgi:hypothetical protein